MASAFSSQVDLNALSEGVSWWYNWSPTYQAQVARVHLEGSADFIPMTWNGNNPEQIRAFLRDNPDLSNEIEKRIKETYGVGAQVDEPADVDVTPVDIYAPIGVVPIDQA